jgi:hypothetical protein
MRDLPRTTKRLRCRATVSVARGWCLALERLISPSPPPNLCGVRLHFVSETHTVRAAWCAISHESPPFPQRLRQISPQRLPRRRRRTLCPIAIFGSSQRRVIVVLGAVGQARLWMNLKG